MLNKTVMILECSRIFSLPMTIFSWLVVFVFGIIDSGNVLYGIIALFGLCFAHLGTNLIDDFFDYKFLIKQVGFDKKEYLKHSQKTKCRYLINGLMSEKKLLSLVFAYFTLAFLCGLFLFNKCGIYIAYFALVGGIIGVLYPFLSRICLSEIAVAIAYGPALFGGVYYVMTGNITSEIFLLSIPSAIMTVILLYIHTVMDYEFDLAEGKYTIANRFNSQLDSLVVLKFLITLAYLSLFILPIFDILDWQVFFVLLTFPIAVDLYNSMVEFSINPENMPQKKWFHFPMEKLEFFAEKGEGAFMFRMLQTRNLMIYFSLFLIIAIVVSLAT